MFKRNRFSAPFDRPGMLRVWSESQDSLWFDKLPDNVKRNLGLSEKHGGPFEPRGSGLGWVETIYHPNADGTAITAAAETILLPDFSIPASYMAVGKVLRYTIFGRQSTAITTPGTITLRLRWGGVAGVSMAASGAFAPDPTAAATNLTWGVQWYTEQRTVGATGTSLTIGICEWSDYDDASATTIVGNLNMRLAPVSAPATATVDTTVDKLLSATYTSSVATASCQAHIGILEALN